MKKYSTCKDCKREMIINGTCRFGYIMDDAGVIYQRRRHNDEGELENLPCHDCNCKVGGLHHYGCDMETCPKCGRQMIGCGCSVWVELKVKKAK